MIELKTLDKTFQMIHASDHITATIPDGMVFGLIGSNGAGKSTLLRMISGILKPDEGEVLIDGESVFENPSVKSQICFLSDTPYFFPNADIQQMRNYTCSVTRRLTENCLTLLQTDLILIQNERSAAFQKV